MRLRPSYANVVSTLALVVAVGGGAYAAVQLPKDSVGSKQIKNSTVKSKDVKDGGLRASDLRAGEIDAEVAGTPMGGSLTGTFPNPTLAPSTLGDLVQNGELAAALADVVDDEQLVTTIEDALADFVFGDRVDASIGLAAGSGHQPLMSIPGVVTVTASCVQAGGLRGLEIRVTNNTASSWQYARRVSSEAPVLEDYDADFLNAGANETFVYPPDATGSDLRDLELTVLNGRLLDLEVTGITNNGVAGCTVRGSAFHDGGNAV